MRIDLALTRLRLTKSRARAQQLAQSGQVRCNGIRVMRASHAVAAGDVVTLPTVQGVQVITIVALPERRGPPAEARSHYRELDQTGETTIAGEVRPTDKRIAAP